MSTFSPFFVGKIKLFHKGCWASTVTEKHKDILLDVFVYDTKTVVYGVLAIIKPVNGSFSQEKRDAIKDTIGRHHTVQRCIPVKLGPKFSLETEYFLILDVVVRDEYKPWGAIRPLEFYGQIPKRDIGHKIRGGWEEVYGLFKTKDSFDKCLAYMIDLHKDLVDRENSSLAEKPGLQLDPPLLMESIACGRTTYEEYRTSIDMSLMRGIIHPETQDNWMELAYKYIKMAREVVPKVPPTAWVLLGKFILYLITHEVVDP